MEIRSNTASLLLLFTAGIFIGFSFFAQLVLGDAIPAFNDVIAELLLILPALVYMAIRHLYWRDIIAFHGISENNIRMSIAVICACYPCVVCLNLFSMMFVENAVSGSISGIISMGLFNALMVVAVIPAFCEEFLMRGLIYRSYSRVSKIGAVILSALFFGLFHMNLNQMAYAVFLGLVFALMVEATGSIWSSMIMHAAMNGFNVALNYLAYGQDPETADEVLENSSTVMVYDAGAAVLLFIVFAVFAVITFFLIRKTFKDNGKDMRAELLGQKKEDSGRKEHLINLWNVAFTGVCIFFILWSMGVC